MARPNEFRLDLRPMTTLSARVPARLAELVRADAEQDECTPSEMMRLIVAQHYNARERAR
jgi:hypothetical protein